MQSENTLDTPSFFDDDDFSTRFDFVKPDRTHFKHLSHPHSIKSVLSRYVSHSDTPEKCVYALHSRMIVSYESLTSKTPVSVLDLAHSRLRVPTPSDDEPYSFSVTRNGNTFVFYSNDKRVIDNWVCALRNVCVLCNFHEEYKALKMIGKGSFAKVYLVESKANKKNFAVKAFTKEGLVISNKANAKPAMLNEIDIMRAVDHENVIKLYEVFETEKSIYLVLELIQGKSLQEMLKKAAFREENSETKILNTIRSILEALAYLASKGVLHRDLKPDNILLDKGEKVKIVDFGLATFTDVSEYIFKKCGTPGYIAPEVFKFDQKNSSTAYDSRCDIFSIGCILYYMYFGTPFFEGSNASEILKCNRKFTIDFEPLNNIKREIKDPQSKIPKDGLNLLLQLLDFDHKKRPTADQALTHPYLVPYFNSMPKIPGFREYAEGTSRSGSFSPPIMSPLKRALSGSPDKFSPLHGDKHRFLEKDSLYLDVGRTEINGRVDTLGGNTQNSLLVANRISELSHHTIGSNSGSLSPFRKSNYTDFKRPSSKSFKGHALLSSNNQPFLKAAIHRNMHHNAEGEDHKEDGSPRLKLEQIKGDKRYRNSDQVTTAHTIHPSSDKLRVGSQSPVYFRYDTHSNDNSPFHLKVEQVQSNSANPMNFTRSTQLILRKNISLGSKN